MRICVLLLTLFGGCPALAAVEWVNLKESTAVYRAGNEDSALLLMANSGERIAVRSRANGFAKIQIKRGGKWRVGYILLSDLAMKENGSGDTWGYGAGGMYSYLRHTGKKFETEDNVNYDMGVTTSKDISPWLTAQYDKRDFWRLILAYRIAGFSSNSTTDVGGASKAVELKYSMVSGTIQKMWTPFSTPSLYWGIGLEASKAMSASLSIAGKTLPVEKSSLPTFLGGHLAAGYQKMFGPTYSLFVEIRGLGFFNQSPIIMGGEAVLGLIYWP